MPTKQHKFFIDLPGKEAVGSFAQDNLIILQKSRYVVLKIEDNNIEEFHVSCSNESFYILKHKCLMKTYKFLPGEQVIFWLAKSFDKTISVYGISKNGERRSFCKLNVKSFDSNLYSGIFDTPAPIMILLKSPVTQIAGGLSLPLQEPRNQDNSPSMNLRFRSDTLQEQKSLSVSSYTARLSEALAAAGTPLDQEGEVHPWPHLKHDAWLRNALEEASKSLAQKEKEHTLIVEISDASFRKHIAGRLDIEKEYCIDSTINSDVHSLVLSVFSEVNDKGGLFRDLHRTTFRLKVTNTSIGRRCFISFTGSGKLRDLIKGSRYVAGIPNKQITSITVGLGTWGNTANIVRNNLAQMPRLNNATGRFFYLALFVDTVNWLHNGTEDGNNLLASWITTAMVATGTHVIAPVIATTIGKCLMTAVAGAVFSTSSLIIGGALLVIGVGWMLGLIASELDLQQKIYNMLIYHQETALEYYRQSDDPSFFPFCG